MNLLYAQNRITELMARWVVSLKGAGSMSHRDLNIVSETILVPLLSEVYDLPHLRSLNTPEIPNYPAVDLADDQARVAIQVTSTANSRKIKHTLTQFVKHKRYEDYDRLIVYILVEKQKSYSGRGFEDIIGGRFHFDKVRDIRDYRDLLAVIAGFQVDRARRILDILEANFGAETGPAPPPSPPATEGEYLIIVTQFKRESLARNLDVRNVLADGIRDVLPEDLNARVEVADGVTPQTRDEARSIGGRHSATIILWGRYTDNLFEVNFTPLVEQDFPTETRERRVIAQTVDELAVFVNDLAAGWVRWLSLLTIGQALYFADRDSDARAQFDAALALVERMEPDPHQLAATFFYRANTHLHQGSYGLAIADYDQALALNPESAAAYNNRGNARSDLGQHETAIDDYDQAIALNPESAAAYNNRGLVRSELGQHEAAIAAFQQAIALDEKSAYFRNNLGNVYRDQSRHQEAIATYQQAIALDEKLAGPWNGLGNVYADQDRHEEAIAAFQQAIALDEKYAHPWNGLGNVYGDQSRHQEAIAAYQQAIALDEKYASPWNGLGIVYRDQGRHEEAIDAYGQAIALDEKLADPWHGLGNVYGDQGQHEAAIAAYQQAIALDDKLADPWHGLGIVYTLQGELALALEAFRRAATLTPERGMYLSSLVGILRRLGRDQEAAEQESLARPLMARENEYSRACFEAICGNAEEALRLLEIALEKGQAPRAWAAQDPDLESLHGDLRFEELLGDTDGH